MRRYETSLLFSFLNKLLFALLVMLFCQPCWPQASFVDDWDVVTVSFREEDQGQQIPSDYWPIELSELKKRLDRTFSQRIRRQLDPSRLEEAIYVAYLQRDGMISDRSRWQFHCEENMGELVVGRVSCALTDARNIPEDGKQLSSSLQFGADGDIRIQPDSTQVIRWFGFQNSPSQIAGVDRFDLELPPALLGRMLIASDSSLTISSLQVVVQPIESPQDFLPEDWGTINHPGMVAIDRSSPNSNFPATSNKLKWWLVHLSGVSSFSLVAEPVSTATDRGSQFALSTADVHYSVSRSRVTVEAEYQLAGSSRQPVMVRLDPSLRLVSATIDSQFADWKSLETTGDTSIVQLQSESARPTSRIVLRATASGAIGEPSQPANGSRLTGGTSRIVLPRIELVNSFALQGTIGLAAEDHIRIKRVISDVDFIPVSATSDHNLSADLPGASNSLATRETDAESRTEFPERSRLLPKQQWHARWIGLPPDVEAHWESEQDQWDSEALNLLTVREYSVSTIAHYQLIGRNLSRNSIVLPISADWVVDQAHLADDGGGRYRVQVTRATDGTQQIEVRWQHAATAIRIRLDVVAHLLSSADAGPCCGAESQEGSPTPMNSASWREPGPHLIIEDARLLELPSGHHAVNYGIAEEAGHRLRYRPELLQMILPRQDLPAWQQGLLPRSNILVFGDYSNDRQRFQFDLKAGAFTANLVTLVESSKENGWQCSTQVNCQALSGSVDRIPIVMEVHQLENWKFHFVNIDGLQFEAKPTNVRTNDDSERTEFELVLPTVATDKFMLRIAGPLFQKINGESHALQIITPGLPTATEADSLLLVPDLLSLHDGESAVELMGIGACCEPEIEHTVAQLLKGKSFENFLVARINGTASQRIPTTLISGSQHYHAKPAMSGENVWIWSEVVRHQLDDSGAATHEIRLEVNSRSGDLLTLRFPEHLELSSLTLHDELSSNFIWRPGSLQITLPDGQRNQLVVRLTSQDASLGWFSSSHLHCPEYDVPVLQRQQLVQISPKCHLLSTTLEPEIWDEKRAMSGSLFDSTRTTPPSSRVDRLSRWQCVHLWRWLVPSGMEIPEKPDWTVHELEAPADAGRATSIVWLVDRNSMSTIAWASLVLLSVTSWLVLKKSFRLWWLILSLSIGLNALTPSGWFVVSQLLLMAVMGGSLLRVAERILHKPAFAYRKYATSRSKMATTCLILSLWYCHSIRAQTQVNVTASSSDANNYRVFIPSDENGQPQGEFAFIPKQLRDLLYPTQPSAGQQSAGSFLSANYTVRLRQDDRDLEPVLSCTAELRLSVNQANAEILIPIKGNGLTWTGTPSLNGQPRIWGGRNFTLPNDGSGVRFRAESIGIVQLSLQFSLAPNSDLDKRLGISVEIPPIANAKLRVTSSGSVSNLQVNARGLVQRNFLGETNANLGPIDRLRLTWSVSQRPTSMAPSEQVTETWLTAKGKHLVAACLLTVTRSQLLPREFDLIINGDWQPIGEAWRDVDFVGVSPSGPFQGRTVYRVRRRELVEEPLRIQLMLIPKSETPADGLAAPFISLDRVNTKATYFWWSSDRETAWFPELLDSRPMREDNIADWISFGSSTPRVGYQVLGGTVQLRQQSVPAPNLPISEVHSLRLRRHRTVLDYIANWEPTGNPPEMLMIDIPKSMVPPELEINGVPARFRLDDSQRLMTISLKENGVGRLGRLKLQIELPAICGRVDSVPRVSIWKGPAKRSIYELFQGVATQVRIVESSGPVAFQPSGASLSQVGELMELDRRLGQADLSSWFDNNGRLPLELDVQPASSTQPPYTVLIISETREGWKATVRCVWDEADSIPEFVFFDLPFSARDGLNASATAFKFMPHSDPSRTNLCIPTSVSTHSRHRLEFSFPITASQSSRLIPIPWIRTPDLDRLSFIALPKSVGGQPVRWLWAGRQLGEPSKAESEVQSNDELEFHTIPREITSVVWQSDKETRRVSRSMFNLLDINDNSSSRLIATLHYWIEPNGLVSQRISIPGGCDVLGVDCGDRQAQWLLNGQELTVTLQPNSLPLQIRVLLQWTRDNNGSIHVPVLSDQENYLPLYIKAPAGANNTSRLPGLKAVERYDQVIANCWAEAIVAATTTLPNIPARDVNLWLAQWSPEFVGISQDWVITQPNVLSSSIAVDANNDQQVTVGELWKGLEMIVETTTDFSSLAVQQIGVDNQMALWQLDGNELIIEPEKSKSESRPGKNLGWFLSLIGIAVMALSPWLFGKRLPKLTSTPWLDWWILAGILALLVPVIWPSLVFVLVGTGLAVLHLLDSRNSAYRV